MLPVFIENTRHWAKSPVVKTGRQVSALTSGRPGLDCRIRHCVAQTSVREISKALPCWAVSVIELLLGQRRFRVHMGDISSSWRMQKNGLPQGSVLAPTLLNLYINDLPATMCRKFIYTDDICLAHQARKFEELNTTINTDIDIDQQIM